MCGRDHFTTGSDDMSAAIVGMLDKRFPGEYKTGKIFPGDAAPAVVSDCGRIVAIPAVFGFPGYQEGKRIINARSEMAAQKPIIVGREAVRPYLNDYETALDLISTASPMLSREPA